MGSCAAANNITIMLRLRLGPIVVALLLLSLLPGSGSAFSFVVPSATTTTTSGQQRVTATRRTTTTTPATRSFLSAPTSTTVTTTTEEEDAPREEDNDTTAASSSPLAERVLQAMQAVAQEEADEYADHWGLSRVEAAVYALLAAVRRTPVPLGLNAAAQPFCLRRAAVEEALLLKNKKEEDSAGGGGGGLWAGFFTMEDLERALQDDFLDAARGSTDNRKGWQITDVSVPRGESFEEARLTFEDVQTALQKGTVILNAAGAHIPQLAGMSLACTDATALPCALNLYVTAADKRTSAPPHTDKQDVLVLQTQGCKHWKVYAPPDPALKPNADIFARGKMDDSLPLYSLLETGELLLETTLHPGDVLFVPAGCPHTTTTTTAVTTDGDGDGDHDDTSVHLTLGIDHHIWELDYLQARRLALRRACVTDTALGHSADGSNPFVGKVNQLPDAVRRDLLAELPLGLLDDDDKERAAARIDRTAAELERISHAVDAETASRVDSAVWRETVERVRQQGMELLEIHRDMYLAAIEEGRTREAEEAMTAHVKTTTTQQRRPTLSPERMQRLSLFRVKRYYDQINESKQKLDAWSLAKAPAATIDENAAAALAADWAFSMPVKVGDEVEAELGGAFFPATVTRASSSSPGGGTYDVAFFDGDRETGLDRSQIKLLSPPKPAAVSAEDADAFPMTAKQRKRWQKQQEKMNKKGM